jgi:hypothetical protein
MIEPCLDFANETMVLRSRTMGEKMGVGVVLMTKFHAEVAGEGIEEYLWGVAESWYHSKPLQIE